MMGIQRSCGVVLALALSANLASCLGNPQSTTDAKCNCYLTNTTAQSFFSGHKFFDFRNMAQYAKVSPLIQDPTASSQANVTNDYFASAEWKNYWEIQSWNKSAGHDDSSDNDGTMLMVNSPNNIYFEINNDSRPASQTYLTLRTARHEAFQSAAEFDSSSVDYRYVSMRMSARTRGAPGAVTAMFTYRGGNTASNVQEADLEVRTIDPKNVIQYTNQPSTTGSTQNITLPAHTTWSDWQYHRVDWTPGSSTWFVNGQPVSHITSQAPRDPSALLFNAWSDGGSWSGSMAVGAEAYLQIQWIDMVFNNTNANTNPHPAAQNGKCSNICSIDQTRTIGTPVLISSNPSGGQACFASKYGQCAGRNFNGCTGCAQGLSCKYQNDYYSQCL